eukprot:TRINITY_DN336_c0_g2_i1.p1 TRINITY_DN336_c0_g2~~TRINITY_DN336_c0_g2_i1.p1  ORF type:complete len:461 (+),score=133.95 TRINITY_DN336_c0_g2_i1:97-1479(+)
MRCSSKLLSRVAKTASVTATATVKPKLSTQQLIDMEDKYAAHNYHPLPAVFSKAKGCVMWDPEGKKYYDFLSAYSAVNQGHCHPKILKALRDQSKNVTLSSRAFYNETFPQWAKFMSEYFHFDKLLPINGGVEAVETALKLAKKWGTDVKKIPDGEQMIISACGCFHGRTFGAISLSCDPDCWKGFGPRVPGMLKVAFDDLNDLEAKLKQYGSKVCAFLVEPIQGEAGVFVPKDGYLKGVRELCTKYNVLFIADEIQTGCGRTGKLLACDYENVRPDVLVMGKALSGGMYPISAVMADDPIMHVFTPGSHGSTFGGNPLAAAISMAALTAIKEEKMVENSFAMGQYLREKLVALKSPLVTLVRGRGLLNAMVIREDFERTAWDLCLLMRSRGLLAKPTHDNIIRFAPPLIINKKQMDECIGIIKSSLEDIQTIPLEKIPFADPNGKKHAPPLCQVCGKRI